jgi:hypothetical protein
MCRGWGHRRLLFQNAVALRHLPRARGRRRRLLAAQDDLLEQEDVVLAVDVALRDHEEVVEDEVAEVRYGVALPVLDAVLQVLNGGDVLDPPLCLVDLVGDPLGSVEALHELVIIRVLLFRGRLDQVLQGCV